MSFLSTGPYNYNRFAELEEQRLREKMYFMEKKKAKKDYDGDGEVESSSKEHAGVVHNAIQRKKGGTPDGKDTRGEVKESCHPGCDCEDCSKRSKKMKKEEFEGQVQEWVDELVAEGYDLSEYTWEEMEDLYLEAMKPGPRREKMRAKMYDPYVRGGSKSRGQAHNIAVRGDVSTGDPAIKSRGGGGVKKDKGMGYGDRGAGNKARRRAGQEPLRGNTRKEEFTREDVIDYLMESGFTNNPVSAEVLIDNMSEAWLESIVDELKG